MNVYECVLLVWDTDESLWRGQCSEGAASFIGECGTVQALADGISEEGAEQDLSSMSKQAHK